MEGRYGVYRERSSRWISMSMRIEELEEEEVWDVLGDTTRSQNGTSSTTTTSVALRHFPTAAKMIPKKPISIINPIHHQSAPLHIPDWSKIYGANSNIIPSKNDHDVNYVMKDSWESSDDGDDVMPPHEWIAKKLARDQLIPSFSVCEGAGRTLKGRDLSRVRNAVLTRTGFLE